MSATQAYLTMAFKALQRNNPILEIIGRFQQIIYMLLNYNSNVKLNRYRHSLYSQQLQRMEGYLDEGSPYKYRGNKLNRHY